MNITKDGSNITLKGDTYTLTYDAEKPFYVDLTFSNGIGAELFVASGCDRDELVDELVSLDAPSVEESGETATLTFVGKTTLWDKVEYRFECRSDKVLYNYTVHGKGSLDNARFFEGFEEDNPNVKDRGYPYFPGWGRHVAHHRPLKYFTTSSKPKFDLIHSYTVNASDTRIFMYHETTKIRVGGDRFYLGGDWLVTPPPFLYLLGNREKNTWVNMGLVAKAGENNYLDYEYLGGEGWGLNCNYQGYTKIDGDWTSPQILFEMHDGANVYDALEKYVGYLRANGMVKKNAHRKDAPRWWHEPIFGGWGEQMVYSSHWPNYFAGTSKGWSGGSDGYCTRAYYEKMLGQLEDKGVDPTILIIDNRWFVKPHMLDVCDEAWPNMREFVDEQHAKGRKVILWVSPWGYNRSSWANGKEVPVNEHMILEKEMAYELEIDTDIFYIDQKIDPATNEVVRFKPEKRKKRVPAEFNMEERDWEYLADPFNPDYVKRVQEKVQYLLSPDGLDADGFEFDYTHFLPIYRNIKPATPREEKYWGVEMLHRIIEIYYEAAKKAKPDSLIIDHIFNPYFDDVTDMLRLQDIYTDARSIVEQYGHRARIGQKVVPGCAIHTDQHPMPSIEAWREYAQYQSNIGNPCLYYVTAIETTREKLTDEDYKLLRETWEAHHKKLDEKFGPREK